MHKLVRFTLALACVCAIPALGQESTSASKSAAPRAGINQASSDTADEAARVQAVRDYWTSDRLASAIPMPVPRVSPEDVSATAAPLSNQPLHVGAGGLPSYRDKTATESST